jgi:hypothetical protein
MTQIRPMQPTSRVNKAIFALVWAVAFVQIAFLLNSVVLIGLGLLSDEDTPEAAARSGQ